MSLCYFVSDIHLTDVESDKAQILLNFIKELNKKAESEIQLFFVGDIFDLWVHDYNYFTNKFKPIIDELKAFTNQGQKLYYFEGNHDLYLKTFWEKEVKAQVITEEAYFDLNGLKVRVEHGDLSDPEDKGYLFLRAFLRNPFIKFIFTHLPGVFIAWLGKKMSKASRKYTSDIKTTTEDVSKAKTIDYAHKCYQLQPFDLMITGHTHVFDDYQGEHFRSINLGSWFDEPKCLVIDEKKEILTNKLEK